jgi:hypothetical protein
LIAVTALVACLVVWGSDWPSQGGNPQRDGWAKYEKAFTKENVRGLQLLYSYQADNQARGLNALTAPLVNGLLITYRGFKEMLVFGGSSDVVYSVDADLESAIARESAVARGRKARWFLFRWVNSCFGDAG